MSVQILSYLHKSAMVLLSLELESGHHCKQERDCERQGRDIWGNGREAVQEKRAWDVEKLTEKLREDGEQCQEVTRAGGDKE